MPRGLDLKAEMERRDVSLEELARAAQVSKSAVSRIRTGRSGGRAATRRALRAALALYPPVEEEAAAS